MRLKELEQEIKNATTVKRLREINKEVTEIAIKAVKNEERDYELLKYADKLGTLAIEKTKNILDGGKNEH